MHLADLKSYLEADHRLVDLNADREEWTRKAILNVASSGKRGRSARVGYLTNQPRTIGVGAQYKF